MCDIHIVELVFNFLLVISNWWMHIRIIWEDLE